MILQVLLLFFTVTKTFTQALYQINFLFFNDNPISKLFDKFDLICLYCKMNLRYLLWNLKIGRETTLSWFIFHNICRVLFPRGQFWSRFLRLESPVNHKRGKWAWLYHYLRSQMIASYNTSTYPVIDVHMQAVIVSFFFKYNHVRINERVLYLLQLHSA